MTSSRPRAIRPALKPSKLDHKPRVPSRLSLSSLPPLPPLPVTGSSRAAVPPSVDSPALTDPMKRSPSPTSRGPRVRRPSPPPRRNKTVVDSALHGVGAVYIGWATPKGDPAPLCCPVAKEKMKARFGEAAVGWMTSPAPSQPALPVDIPPIPYAPATDDPSDFLANFAPSPSYSDTPSLSPESVLAFESPSPNSSTSYSPSLFPYDLSAALSISPSDAFSPSSTLLLNDSSSELTIALPCKQDDLAYASRPSSPRQPTFAMSDVKLELGDDDDNSDALSESLWSSAEDGATLFSSSSGASEASWAW